MADTMMLMKQRVLDMAVRGELVEQREEEGTAEELLSEIKEEKERLIKEKKIKREKPLPEIERENIPFNIPKNWKWVRLGQVGDWGAGATPERGNLSYWKDGTIPWIKTGELNNSHVKLSEEFITEKAVKENSVRLNKPGDILIAMYGATIGKLGILDIEATTNQACCACTTFEEMNSMYLFYFLMSNKQNFINSSEGGAQPNISRTKIVRELIPLPPLAEQERIVSKIESLFIIIDKISEKKEDSLKLIDNIRKTALQDAVMGKLVEQDEEDEPASELVKKILEEKEQLIKEKKIRKDKQIEEVQKPESMPANWEVIKFGNVAEYKKGPFGSSITKSMFVPKDSTTYKVYEQKNAIQKNYLLGEYYITKEKFEELKSNEVQPGDIIVSCAGTVGETYILPDNIERGIINQALMRVRLTKFVDEQYFLMYFSSILEVQIQNKSKGSVIKNIPPLNVLKNIDMKLPPFDEQKRIVKKYNQIMAICDQMEEILDGSREETPVGK